MHSKAIWREASATGAQTMVVFAAVVVKKEREPFGPRRSFTGEISA